MYLLFLFGTILAITQGFSVDVVDLEKTPPAIPVPVQFITQADQRYGGSTNIQYHASLCGGTFFDGLMARFAINLANNLWNFDKGDYITVIAKDSAGNPLASNINVTTKLPNQDFNFTYYKKYKDLYFNVTTGPAPGFIFTLSLSFDYNVLKDHGLPSKARWQMTPMEHARFLNSSKGDDSVLLVPIFITHTKQTVTTGELQYLRLDYCFGLGLQYNITIAVVADDQRSGFATYACKKTYEQGKCDVRTPFRDISGGPANFVEVSLYGPQDYGPINVIVRGDGRFGQPNNYILTASTPY